MIRRAWLAAATLAAALAPAAAAAAGTPISHSRLALPLVMNDPRPTLVYAQRAIERSWGPSDDSIYVEVEVPQWRSEGLAVGLSAAFPGAGQLYAGERRGLWYVVAEVAGWTARQIYRHRGSELRRVAADYAGAPSDSGAAWSFARWNAASQGERAELEQLWAADREAFYDRIAGDSKYLSGWEGDAPERQKNFRDLREIVDARYRNARITEVLLWVNHLVSAADALRAARLHNLPLGPQLGLKLKSGWTARGPALRATLVRTF